MALALALVLVYQVAGGRVQAQGPVVPALLGAPALGARVPPRLSQRPDTLASRAVSVNRSALAADTLDIELTEGRTVRAHLERRETARNGATTWAGRVQGEPLSTVTLVSFGGVLQGTVRTLSGAYTIEPAASGPLHVVRLVDVDATGADLEPLVPPPDATPVGADPPVAGDDGSTIDVLAFYTAAAVTAAGSEMAAQARITLGIVETNTAFANSGILPRLRLVGAEFTNYVETGDFSVDLSRFQAAGDGSMDEVHARRNAVGADMMVLIVGDATSGCGIGYVLTSLSAGFAPHAFSVTAYPCISPNYTLAHELGHNMGSAHAPEDGAGQSSLYPYSFGYKDPANLFRTVMAYNCAAGCPRILHFSNPSVSHSGQPTGTALQHDNARSINNAAMTVANWRQAVGGGTPPTISAISNVTIAEDSSTAALAFTVGDAETAAADLVVTATSSSTTLVPNTGAALALGGSLANRTLVVTPTANGSGTATISVTVSDGALTATRNFTLTVTAVDDPPLVSRSPASATTAVGLVASTTVTITDIDTAGNALTLTTSSPNTTVLPQANVAVSVTSTTATSRTFQVTMAPATGGSAMVTLNGADATTVVATTFALTATMPQPPTVSPIAAQSMPEDTARDVEFTVGDDDTPLNTLAVSAASSDEAVVPTAGLVLSGSDGARSLRIRPVPGASGAVTITVTVHDGLTMAQASFVLTVTPVDDPPAFAAGVPTAVSTVVGVSTSFPVTITDPDTASGQLSLAVTTTNPALLANAGIVVTPTASTSTSRTFDVSLTPLAGMTGRGGLSLLGGDLSSNVSRSVQLLVTSSPAPPDAPTMLEVSLAGPTATFSWVQATTGSTATSFAVQVGTAPGATTLPELTTSATTLATTIATGGTFYARVRAVNQYGTSVASPEVSFTLASPNPRPGPPAALDASFSGRTITVRWMAPTTGNPVTNYSLEAGSAPGLANIVTVPVGTATSFSASGVPDGTYWLRVRGGNSAGVSPPTSDLGVVMGPGGGCVGLPLAPALATPTVSGSRVTLQWTAPATGSAPVGYVIYAGRGPGRSDAAMVDVGAATEFSAQAPAGTYYVRVAARGVCGVGAQSNEAIVTVSTSGVVPVAPGGLSAIARDGEVTVSWMAPTSGAVPTGYLVEVGTNTGLTNVASVSVGAATLSLSGRPAPGRYVIRVRSRAGTLISAPSADVTVDVP